MPAPWASLHRADEVDISQTHQLELENRPWWHRASLENEPRGKEEKHRILRREFSRIPPQTDAQLAAMTANYFNMIAFIDDGVGKILRCLAETGLEHDTIVIFTSDHGELLGDHGLYLKGPMMYDNLLRVGMIMRGPDIPAGNVISSPVSTMDLAATFCTWGGTVLSEAAQSVSLLNILEGDPPAQDFVYSEWNLAPARVGVELQLRTIRTETARLTVDLISGAGELYNFVEDPQEMHNLWDDPAANGLKQEMMIGYSSAPDQSSPSCRSILSDGGLIPPLLQQALFFGWFNWTITHYLIKHLIKRITGTAGCRYIIISLHYWYRRCYSAVSLV